MRHPPVTGADQLNFELHILTQHSSPVKFLIQSFNGSYNHSGQTSAESHQVINIPDEFHTTQNTYNQRHNGLRISTLETEPVSVIAYSWRSSDYTAYNAWPCHEQPTMDYVYYIVSLLSTAKTATNESNDSVSEFLLVGCRDNTSITITPTQDIKMPENLEMQGSPNITVLSGSSHSFTIHQFQTLLVAEAKVDLSGTKITSDKPVTVLSGHEIVQVPLGAKDGDPVITQLTPTITWGKQFLIPTDKRPSGRLLKVTASENDTTVDMQCGTSTYISVTLVTAGSAREVELNFSSYCGAVSNKPVHLAMFGHSSSENDVDESGDPYLIAIPPLEQYIHSVQVSTVSDVLADTTVVIIMPENAFASNEVLLGTSSLLLQPQQDIFFPDGTLAGHGYAFTYSSNYGTFSHPEKQGTLFVSAYGYSTKPCPGLVSCGAGLAYSAGAMQYPIATTSVFSEISFTAAEYTVEESAGQVTMTLERSKKFDGEVVVHFLTSPHPVDTATGQKKHM